MKLRRASIGGRQNCKKMFIRIATPLSTLFLKKNDNLKKVIALSDVLEIRDISPNFISFLPKIYHSDLSIVKKWTAEESANAVNIVKKNNAVLISFHIAACYPRAVLEGGVFWPRGKMMSPGEMLKNARRNTIFLRNKLKNIDIAVENNNYFPTGAYEIVTEINFINKLISNNDLKLLLDFGHAAITAYYHGIVLDDYLKNFIFSRVCQIHLSGPERRGDNYKDAHKELSDSEWKKFEKLINFFSVLKFVTIEYYNELPTLIKMLIKLKKVINENEKSSLIPN